MPRERTEWGVIATKRGLRSIMIGRKRKTGRRHPNGALVRERVDYRALAGLQPHRRDLPEAARLSEKAGEPLGNLNLIGAISDEQHEAGRLYAGDCGAYFATIGVPAGLAGGGRGFDCRGSQRCEPCECKARKSAYDAAFEAVMAAGQRCAKAVAHVAVHGKKMQHGELAPLKKGLDALLIHYGLTVRRNFASSRNRN